MQTPVNTPSDPQYAITDLYDPQRRKFLIQYSPLFVIVMSLAGVVAFAITGFFGYAAPANNRFGNGVDALFQKPWLLFFWFCALMITLLWSIFRNPALRRQRLQVLIMMAASIILVTLAYYFRDTFISLVNAIHNFLARVFNIHIDQDLLLAFLNYGILVTFWASSIRRWIRRWRGLSIAPEVDIGLPDSKGLFQIKPPSLSELISGTFIGGGVLAAILWGVFSPSTLSGIATLFGAPNTHPQCLTNCSAIDFDQLLLYAFVGLLILALAATVNGLGAMNAVRVSPAEQAAAEATVTPETSTDKGTQGVIQTLINTLLGSFTGRGSGSAATLLASLALALRAIAWPALLLVGTAGLAVTAQYIQFYLHATSCVHQTTIAASCDFYSVSHHDIGEIGLDLGIALIGGIAALAGTVLSPALLVFRWRVASNTLSFVRFIGLIVLLTLWIFSLTLSGVNLFFSPTVVGATERWPFAQPGIATILSFGVLLVYTVILFVHQGRRGTSARPPSTLGVFFGGRRQSPPVA